MFITASEQVIIGREHPIYNAANIESIEGEKDESGDYRDEREKLAKVAFP